MTDSCEGCRHRVGYAGSLRASCWYLMRPEPGDVQQECLWMIEEWARLGRRGACPCMEVE